MSLRKDVKEKESRKKEVGGNRSNGLTVEGSGTVTKVPSSKSSDKESNRRNSLLVRDSILGEDP